MAIPNGCIDRLAKELPAGIALWDFGESQTVAPIADVSVGGYLTRSVAFMYDKAALELGTLDKKANLRDFAKEIEISFQHDTEESLRAKFQAVAKEIQEKR